MFDVGIGEVGLIAVIALLVLGPERLPGAARTAGALLRKARQSWQSVRAEIEREIAADELKRSIQQTTASAEEMKRSIQQTTAAADPTPQLRATVHDLGATATMPADTPATAAAASDEQH
jgi:sec-independent protein translocase protein TatB